MFIVILYEELNWKLPYISGQCSSWFFVSGAKTENPYIIASIFILIFCIRSSDLEQQRPPLGNLQVDKPSRLIVICICVCICICICICICKNKKRHGDTGKPLGGREAEGDDLQHLQLRFRPEREGRRRGCEVKTSFYWFQQRKKFLKIWLVSFSQSDA